MQDSGSGRRKFDQVFKQEAVKLMIEGKRTVADVSRSLGVHENHCIAGRVSTKTILKAVFPVSAVAGSFIGERLL